MPNERKTIDDRSRDERGAFAVGVYVLIRRPTSERETMLLCDYQPRSARRPPLMSLVMLRPTMASPRFSETAASLAGSL